jgi:hypothetical protein
VTQGESFYQYNGKELNEDFGLDMYDYPSLPRLLGEFSGQVGARFGVYPESSGMRVWGVLE